VSLLLFLGIIKGGGDLPSHTVWPALFCLRHLSWAVCLSSKL
jgi:hypothetical protein